jgi:hypothetical protein
MSHSHIQHFGHKAVRPRFSGLRYHRSSQEQFSHILHRGKRMFGGSYLSHGPAIGLSALSSARRLPVKGGHSGRVIPPPSTKEDQIYLYFSAEGVVYVPACRNCGLAVAPWFFTKAMRPVVSFLRARGHRVFSYLDDFFGAAATVRNNHTATEADTRRLGRDVHELFSRLGLTLHPTKAISKAFARWRFLIFLSTPAARGIYFLQRSCARRRVWRAYCSRMHHEIGSTSPRAASGVSWGFGIQPH